MLYLIRSYTKEDGPILKIGYARDMDSREISYRTHNPGYELLGTREGDEDLERKFHRFLTLYSYKNFPEWFWFEEEIVRIFKEESDEFFSNPISITLKEFTKREKELLDYKIYSIKFPHIKDFLNKFYILTTTSKTRLRLLCEHLKENPDQEKEVIESVPRYISHFYTVLGSERCWNFGYQMSKLEKEYQKQLQNQKVSKNDLLSLIYSTFQEGERYTKAQLKEVVQGIYDHLGLRKIGKASDFEEWFEITPCTITNLSTKKRENGFRLIKRKL